MRLIIACSSALLTACGGSDIASTRLGACGTTPAPALFEHALCLCGDYLDVGRAKIGPGRDPASIAVNGRSRTVSYTAVEGDFIAYGGLEATADLNVRGDLESAGDVTWVGALDVEGDLSVGGDLEGIGALEVEGSVAVGGDRFTLGLETAGGDATYVAPAGPPCGCDPATFLDVAALVALARDDNDNAARGIEEDRVLAVGDVSLELETGRYYFQDVAAVGRARLTISGAVSLYLDGDLATVGDGQIEINPGSSLDLYVAGHVAHVGKIELGDPDDPSAFRLYVGGEKPVQVGVGWSEIAGSIYAPLAQILWVGATYVDGAVFAHDLGGVGDLGIRYTRPVAVEVEPGECPEPREPEPQQPAGSDDDRDPPPGGPDV
jgi:hypothetical protein